MSKSYIVLQKKETDYYQYQSFLGELLDTQLINRVESNLKDYLNLPEIGEHPAWRKKITECLGQNYQQHVPYTLNEFKKICQKLSHQSVFSKYCLFSPSKPPVEPHLSHDSKMNMQLQIKKFYQLVLEADSNKGLEKLNAFLIHAIKESRDANRLHYIQQNPSKFSQFKDAPDINKTMTLAHDNQERSGRKTTLKI